jgi:hypothetical protein
MGQQLTVLFEDGGEKNKVPDRIVANKENAFMRVLVPPDKNSEKPGT